jgi:thioredoxin 1
MRNHPLFLTMNITEFQQRVSQAGKPVVIDFWASWCAPCRVTKPILESLAGEYGNKVQFLFINADESRDVLEQFRVIGIPTVLALRDGEVVGRVTGAQNEAGYRAIFDALLEGRSIKIPLRPFDRMLRLGAGGLLVMVGISTNSWLIAGLGAILVFLGVYDRCPIWAALTRVAKSWR